MSNYRLHVLRQDSTAASLILAVSSSPLREGSSIPTASYDSWERLQSTLSAVGIHPRALKDAEQSLIAGGFCTFKDIPLTLDQLAVLGLRNLPAHLAA
jgi:hypothetical protein